MLTALLAAAGLFHGSLSLGIGSSYDYAGVRAEIRATHVALSAALGKGGVFALDPDRPEGPNRNVDWFPALGLRLFGGDGRGFVAAFTWTSHGYERNYDDPCCFDRTAHLDTLTAAAGWRFRFDSGLYLEALAGVGESILRGHPSVSGINSTPGPFQREISVIPDLALGIGFEL